MLEEIRGPKDVKNLTEAEQIILADEIRAFLIETVAKTGGHLASNLCVVELTLALHAVFDSPKDKIVWDVGHQSYVHKILTGRLEQFDTLRKWNGLSGFPNPRESEHDSFNAGHSSTSLSVALGMAKARDLNGENHHVVAVIGDGALTGGMAFEALNYIGSSKTNVMVILNDNEMSISKNVGALAEKFNNIRINRFYTRTNTFLRRLVKRVPYVGDWIIQQVRKLKYSIKQLIIPDMFFENMGFKYLGPIDGHNTEKLKGIFKICKTLKGPILIHLKTIKGKGYKFSEESPDRFHGVAPFCVNTGELLKPAKRDYSSVSGHKLSELSNFDKKIVCVTAAMRDGTGLAEFSEKYPDRYVDVGIAEQNAVTMCAAMAKEGLKPFFIVYSSFMQRAYDQIIHDIAIQELGVTLCIDRAGIVGSDGETHQGIFDLSYLSSIPNMTIASPKNFGELERMIEFALEYRKPFAIRYPRGSEREGLFKEDNKKIVLGKAEYIERGNDISLIALGKMVERAVEVAERLKQSGVSCEVINVRFLKPIDTKVILESARKTKRVITIEDNLLIGGLATKVSEIILGMPERVGLKSYGYPDTFIKHGSVEEIEEYYGLSAQKITQELLAYLSKKENVS